MRARSNDTFARLTARLPILLAAVVAAAAVIGPSRGLSAADDGKPKATTSRAAREEATRAMPLAKLNRDARAKATNVIKNTSVYRRLPAQAIDCEPDLYAFLARNPEVVVNIWHLMGITKMTLDRVDATRYKVADGEGTKGQMEYLYASPELTVIYSEGTYDGPLYPRTVRGKCLMLLRTNYAQRSDGRYAIVGQLDTFLAVENLGVEVLAKTFQPIIGKAADHNYLETANFVANLSRTAETNDQGLIRLCRKMNRVDAKTRQQFFDLVAAVPEKMAAAQVAQLSDADVVDSQQR
jgi:hypothetical protein